MFKQAVEYRKRNNKQKSKAKASILLVDGDRDQRNDDGWTIARLKQESIKEKFQLCVQQPNQEGLFLRMMPGNERMQPNSMNIDKQLIKVWPSYQKPVDAQALSLKFK